MIEPYELEYSMQLLHIAKRFADRDRLQNLLNACGENAEISEVTLMEITLQLPSLIFEDVTYQEHEEDDRRMLQERFVYIMRDSLFSRFDSLCREYEEFCGIEPIENTILTSIQTATENAMYLHSYSYTYAFYNSLKDRKGPKLVLILDPEFDAYYELPDALFGVLDACTYWIDALEAELTRLRQQAREQSEKVVNFPRKRARKTKADKQTKKEAA